MQILVVDDDPAVLRGVVRQLRNIGHSVISAPTARTAIETARLDEPDLLISDVQMSPQDGFELVRQIRRSFSSIACILMTGNPQVSLPPDLCGVPLLSKPFDFEQLQHALDESIAQPASITTGTPPGRDLI